jgi:hypothetical protein
MTNDPGRDRDAAMNTVPDGLEERLVEVRMQGLSDDANQRLTSELREVIGKQRVRVPRVRAHAELETPRRGIALLGDGRFLFRITLPVGCVVAAIVALTIGTWWILVIAVVVLLVATYDVTAYIYRLFDLRDELAPETNALLEEEGVRDPEVLFSDLVAEFTEDDRI